MIKQIGITIGVVIVFLAIVISFAAAQEQAACLPPNLSCPQCIVTCPDIPACPNVTLTCAENTIQPQGLWEVTTNKRLCGEIVLGASWVIIGGETLMLNKVKKMILVESCN